MVNSSGKFGAGHADLGSVDVRLRVSAIHAGSGMSVSRTAKSPSTRAIRHVGQITDIETGQGFIVASGWAAQDGGLAPNGSVEIMLADGTRHVASRLFLHPGLAQRGICREACAFIIDIACGKAALNGTLKLLVGGNPVSSHRFEASGLKHFQARGAIEAVGPSLLKGWVYHPGLYEINEPPVVELVVDGSARLALPIKVPRPDLPFVGSPERPIGFELGAADVVRALSRIKQSRRLLEDAASFELVVEGETVARTELPRVAAPAQATPTAPPEPKGYIDYFGHSPDLGGWILGGWISNVDLQRVASGSGQLQFSGGTVEGDSLFAWYDREDVREFGIGFVAFVSGETAEPTWSLQAVILNPGNPRLLHLAAAARNMPQAEVISAARYQIGNSEGQELGILLRRPTFEGRDTLDSLPVPILLEVDSFVGCEGNGAVLMGWMVDPTRAVASIRLRHATGNSPSILGHTLWYERRDILDAFGPRFALEDSKLGFLAFAPVQSSRLHGAYLEVQLQDGSVAFKTLPPPSPSSVGMLRSFLSNAAVPADSISDAFGRVLVPAALAMNRARLAQTSEPSIVEIGPQPEHPSISIIIPLYGRVDWVLHQCAHFSTSPPSSCEIIYVLDDPPRKDELVALAHSCWRRFGIPMRLLLLPRNLGFSPANNIGLRHSRGQYICFLNSDVLPCRPGWLNTMVEALDADDKLGAIGATLLFEDGTLQHGGMEMRRFSQLGNLLFPIHPGKGRAVPKGAEIRRVDAITGACMIMRRDLVIELGGFDEDYIIGDFEDVDLCRRIQSKGLGTAVHGGVTMWHLERQSQGAPGLSWRHNVTMVNAWTFATKWSEMVSGTGHAPDGVVRLS